MNCSPNLHDPKSAIDFWRPVCPCSQAGGDRQEDIFNKEMREN